MCVWCTISNRMPYNNYNSYGWTGYLSCDWITGKCNVPWSWTFMNHDGTAQGNDSGVAIFVYSSSSWIRQKLGVCYMCFIPTVWKVFPCPCRTLRNFWQSFRQEVKIAEDQLAPLSELSALCYVIADDFSEVTVAEDQKQDPVHDEIMQCTPLSQAVVMTLCPFPGFQGNGHQKRFLWLLHHSSYNRALHIILHSRGYMIIIFIYSLFVHCPVVHMLP
jgi:hypothetical protein